MSIILFNWEQMYQDRDHWENYMLPSASDKEILAQHSCKSRNVLHKLLNAHSYEAVMVWYDHSLRSIISKRLTYLQLKKADSLDQWRNVWLWYDNLPYDAVTYPDSALVYQQNIPEVKHSISVLGRRSYNVSRMQEDHKDMTLKFRIVCADYYKSSEHQINVRDILDRKYGILNMMSGEMVTPCIFSYVWPNFFNIEKNVYVCVSFNDKNFIVRAEDGAIVSELVNSNDSITIRGDRVVICHGQSNHPSYFSCIQDTPSNYKELFSVEDLAKYSSIPGSAYYFKSRDSQNRSMEDLITCSLSQEKLISELKHMMISFNPTVQEAEDAVISSLLNKTVVLGDKQFSYAELLREKNPGYFNTLVFNMTQPEAFMKWEKYSKWSKELAALTASYKNTLQCIEDYNIPEWREETHSVKECYKGGDDVSGKV